MTGTIDFRTPGAGFDQPIEMWLACHERVQRFALERNRKRVLGWESQAAGDPDNHEEERT